MRITVFGSTGATGEQIVRLALADGHDVVAVARRPQAVKLANPRLRIVRGDVLEPASLHEAVSGADAVLSALGSQGRRPTTVYSAGTAAILTAMRDSGVRRFVGISAVPAGPDERKAALQRYVVDPIVHLFFAGAYDDMRRMEQVVIASDRDWTVFRPPWLNDHPPTGHYRMQVDDPLPRAFKLSRADLATAMLAAIADRALFGRMVAVAE